jgi:hypothetical protein
MSDHLTQSRCIADDDWAYACAVALKTQDPVQRNLLQIIAKAQGLALPRFPGAQQSPQNPSPAT